MNPYLEKQWVEKARQDPPAFRRLYDHYFPRLYAYVSYRVGRAQDAEDLVAETFLKAIEKIEQFEWRGDGSFAAWLFGIAHNQVKGFYRRNHRRGGGPLPLEELPEMNAGSLLPEDAVLQKERFANLYRLIATLSHRRQEVVTLRFFSGLRNKEIAVVLGLDERSVASHLCRALEDLHRKHIDELTSSKGGKKGERARLGVEQAD